jgi:hypothetical protein
VIFHVSQDAEAFSSKEESIALLGGEGGLQVIPDGAQIQLLDPDLDKEDELFTTGHQVLMGVDAHLHDVRRYLKALEVCFFRSGTPQSLPFIPHTLPTGERCIDDICFCSAQNPEEAKAEPR